jgi:hypothetical protein
MKIRIFILSLVLAASLRADTTLTIGPLITGPGGSGPCWDDTVLLLNPPSATGNFTLSGVSGSGVVNSYMSITANNVQPGPHQHYLYTYSVNMTGMSAAPNHCVRLLIHFGSTYECGDNVLVATPGTNSSPTSATETASGDITFAFGGGCLLPGQYTTGFSMLSDTEPKTNFVTIIDDYTDPAGGGQTNETRTSVVAVVPSVPPDRPYWVYAYPPIPNVFFQGYLQNLTNPVPSNGINFRYQLLDAPSNGLPVTAPLTQTLQVANGLFNGPLPFDPSAFTGGPRWLSVAAQSPGGGFTPLNPPLPISPTPQAVYAYSAGVVSELAPGQAVTGLNGLSDQILLQAGNGIALDTNGNTLVISLAGTTGPLVRPGDVNQGSSAAIQELGRQLDDLRSENAALRKRVDQLEQRQGAIVK